MKTERGYDRRIKVALLGAGGIADAHAKAIRTLPGVEIVAACDVDLSKAQQLGQRWAIPKTFASCDEMLADAKPDVVHILLPPGLHAEFAAQCMAAGADVFVEKPLCISEAECIRLEDVARTFGRKLGVNHNVTFNNAFSRLVAAIRGRHLGAIENVTVYYSVPFGVRALNSQWYEREGPGIVMLETGPHPLSLIVRLVGEAHSASALMSAQVGKLGDTWQMAMQCDRGTAQCYLAIGRVFTETRVHVIGEDGCAFADLRLNYFAVTEHTRFGQMFCNFADTLDVSKSIAKSASQNLKCWAGAVLRKHEPDDAGKMMTSSIAAFYNALRSGSDPPVGLDEGLAVVRSCLKVIKSGQASLPQEEAASCELVTQSL
jgi:predicted dehydrogenase